MNKRYSVNNGYNMNKKSQAFTVFVTLFIIIGMISAFIIVQFLYKDLGKDVYFGTYESGMIDAITDGNKAFIFLDQTAKYGSHISLKDFADNGGIHIQDISKTDAGDAEQDITPKCGSYVYNLWNSESENCHPAKEDISFFISDYMNSHAPQISNMIDISRINYDVYLETSMKQSIASFIAQNQWSFYVFKSGKYKNNIDVQNYIAQKVGAVDTSQGKIKVVCGSAECFDQIANYYYDMFGPQGLNCAYNQYRSAKLPFDPAFSEGRSCAFDCSSWIHWIAYRSGLPAFSKSAPATAYEYMIMADDLVATGDVEYVCGDDVRLTTTNPGQIIYFKSVQNKIPCTRDNVLNNAKKGDIVFSNMMNKPERGHYHAGHILYYAGNGEVIHSSSSKNAVVKVPMYGYQTVAGQAAKGGVIAIYRFRYAQNGFAKIDFTNIESSSPVECQTNVNTVWKITNIASVPEKVSGEKNFKIILSVENPSKECASIIFKPIIEDKSTKYTPSSQQTAVYEENNGQKYKNIEIECSFITDPAKLVEERKTKSCVLFAPNNDQSVKYTITAAAIDSKSRTIGSNMKTVVEVSKPQSTTLVSGTQSRVQSTAKKVSLTKQEEEKAQRTLENIDKQQLMPIIEKYAQKYSIPKPILLGKITVETGADPKYAYKCNFADACGIPQVVYSVHGKKGGSIEKACGRFYTKAEFLADKDCQINAGAYILRGYYNDYAKKGVKVPICLQTATKKTYYEWEAALRAYNGLGGKLMKCNDPYDQHNYVPQVMMYAEHYGYSSATYSQYAIIAKEEIESKGIIGKYSIYPSFTVEMPFDFFLVHNLSMFMNQTSNECRLSSDPKDVCLDAHIKQFNDQTSSKYIVEGVNVELTRDCSGSKEEKIMDSFVESVEDCASSPDFDCQCMLTKGDLSIDIASESNNAVFKFTKSGAEYSASSYFQYIDQNNDPLLIDSTNINSINFVKKLDAMKLGRSNYRQCQSIKNKFRLCLKTGYGVEYYNGKDIVEENITLKFAITIKDNDPPPPITGLSLMSMKHDKNSVIVMFDEPTFNQMKVPDIAGYKIYVSDDLTVFSQDIINIKTVLNNHITLDTKTEGYYVMEDIDIAQEPICYVKDDGNGQYCAFNYKIKDKDGNDISIVLEKNKAYYVESTKKFLYIINGSDPLLNIQSGKELFVAVTAIDTDGNEINNVDPDQKIAMNNNLLNVIPQDLLEPGFVKINNVQKQPMPFGGFIQLDWTEPTIFVDNTPITGNMNYNIYVFTSPCLEDVLCDLSYAAPTRIAEASGNSKQVAITTMNYDTVAITSKNDNEYMYAFVKKT